MKWFMVYIWTTKKRIYQCRWSGFQWPCKFFDACQGSVQRWWFVPAVSTISGKIPWPWYYLMWVPCIMLIIYVQAWCGWWSWLQKRNTLCLVPPHNSHQCTLWSVPPQCMLPPSVVRRPLSWPFVFLGESVFWTALKTPWLICWPVLNLWVSWLLPLRLLWRFCSYPRQGQAPRTPFFLPTLFFSRRQPFWPFVT